MIHTYKYKYYLLLMVHAIKNTIELDTVNNAMELACSFELYSYMQIISAAY